MNKLLDKKTVLQKTVLQKTVLQKTVLKYWPDIILKDKQIEIILSYIDGHDAIGLLPTGYGKSMCYILPPLITNKVIFIISPLISLMEDQKEKLIEKNIAVSTLHSNNTNKTKEIECIIKGDINIVYMSPEFLIDGDGMELASKLIKKNRMGFLAVDECHCISTWGHDFRNNYLNIKQFRINYPTIPILAVTATATEKVVYDIIDNLNLINTKIVRANYDRPNLYIKCIAVNKNDIKINIIDNYITKWKNDKIIIYCNNRKDTEELSIAITNKYNILCASYHAGMDKDIRLNIQKKFSNNELNCIVSTVAFGMGIDQIIRCVIILGAPNSIENYYQMIGRAGRDNLQADTVFFFQHKNIMIEKSINTKKMNLLDEKEQRSVLLHKNECLNNIVKYFYINTCRRKFILEYFNEIPKFFCCNNCDNCCDRELIDYTDKIKKVVFGKNVKFTDVFTEKELEILVNNLLISKRGASYNQTTILIVWVKIITINKKIDNIPLKYRIRII